MMGLISSNLILTHGQPELKLRTSCFKSPHPNGSLMNAVVDAATYTGGESLCLFVSPQHLLKCESPVFEKGKGKWWIFRKSWP